jgi:hypothetical protein
MPFVIPEGLAPEVYPLSWLVGWWHGSGVLGYPGIEEQPFVQTIQFDHDGGPYLSYAATIRLLPDGVDPAEIHGVSADSGAVWHVESGFWRCVPDAADGRGIDGHTVEVMLSDPGGHLSLYLGTVGDGRIDLVSDLIARTSTAAEVSAASRLYGLVQGELMWAWDMAAFGHPMQPYASARLSRQD